MSTQSYQDLVVWQKAMQLVKLIYELTKKLPKEEIYALSSQMRRASVSIPSNIAEGYERNSRKEYIQFLSIARGSNAELRTQLQISVNIEYLTEEDVKEAVEISNEVGKMLGALVKKLTPTP